MTQAWDDVVAYLRLVGSGEIEDATDLLDSAIDRDGIGAINDAFADVCRALMDRIVFPAGTVDIHTVVDHIALRVCDTARDNTAIALDRQRSLLVFLGSEGLPCAARDDVAHWSSEDRLRASIACTIGLIGVVMHDEGRTSAGGRAHDRTAGSGADARRDLRARLARRQRRRTVRRCGAAR